MMLTLFDVEARHDAIKLRLEEIVGIIRSGDGDPTDLAEELANLIFEAKILRANIRYHRELAEVLESSECAGGPH